MSKKKGEGLKSFNRGFNVPDTYIIIFFVVVIAAVMTFLVPKGYYETEDVTSLLFGVVFFFPFFFSFFLLLFLFLYF